MTKANLKVSDVGQVKCVTTCVNPSDVKRALEKRAPKIKLGVHLQNLNNALQQFDGKLLRNEKPGGTMNKLSYALLKVYENVKILGSAMTPQRLALFVRVETILGGEEVGGCLSEIIDINQTLASRGFIDTGHFDGLLSRRSSLLSKLQGNSIFKLVPWSH